MVFLVKINKLQFDPCHHSPQDVDGGGQCPSEHPARMCGAHQTEVSKYLVIHLQQHQVD